MKKTKMIAGVMALALTAAAMTACGNKEESSVPDKPAILVDATKENADSIEVSDASGTETTEASDKTGEAETADTSETSETTKASDSGSGNDSGTDDGQGSGGSESSETSKPAGSGLDAPIPFNAKVSSVADDTLLSRITIFGGKPTLQDSVLVSSDDRTWHTYDSLVSILNRRNNFLMIDGEHYEGMFADALDFNGQAYWLRGEGGSKMYIEQNDKEEVTAVAFSDMKENYEIMLAISVVKITEDPASLDAFAYSHSESENPPAKYDYDGGYMTFFSDRIWCAVFDVDTSHTRRNEDYIRGVMVCRRDRLASYITNE